MILNFIELGHLKFMILVAVNDDFMNADQNKTN